MPASAPEPYLRGVGIDLVDLARFARIVERHGAAFTDRWFSARERAETGGAAHGLAERFAVKEAVWKALGVGRREDAVPWRDICVHGAARGWDVLLTGAVAERAAEGGVRGVTAVSTITADVAAAIAHATVGAGSGEVEMRQLGDRGDEDGRLVQVGGAAALLLDVAEHALDLLRAQAGRLRDGGGVDPVVEAVQAQIHQRVRE
ncbi:phosphopantetheine--protein transferase-like protein [Microbacterium ginsengiterrae]|uniref:Phosphopantetheine--protein transferase-like protein n=1 Tax=Microbacterium ginsengiterrae TaxID=546115 RepID=A0A7W9CD24_9MICO|nr:phosphopantetheine--protein transferase-like protein [Microbacterium ginsengiterrae]